MVVSISLFLALYLIVLIVVIIFSTIAVYHIQRFGFRDQQTTVTTALFFILTGVILGGTVLALAGTDWQQGLEFGVPTIIVP